MRRLFSRRALRHLIVSLSLWGLTANPAVVQADRLAAPPAPIGQEFVIAQQAGDLYRPAVAGHMIVWYGPSPTGAGIFGLPLNADGSLGDKPILIANGPGSRAVPSIAANPDGGYLVVWHERRSGSYDIYARYLDANGQPQGDAFAVSVAKGDQLRPAAVYVPAAKTYFVVWQDGRSGSQTDLYARQVPLAGGAQNLTTPEVAISQAPGYQLIPAITCESDQPRCLIVWQQSFNLLQLATDVIGQVIDVTTGKALGADIVVASGGGYQRAPDAIYNPVTSEYLVVWNDDITARRVSRSGQLVGSKIPISIDSPYQYKPAVSVAPDGSYLIVWEDLRNSRTRGADIYGQYLSAAGAPLGHNIALSNHTSNQYSPALVIAQNNGQAAFLALWEDDEVNRTRLDLRGVWLTAGGK